MMRGTKIAAWTMVAAGVCVAARAAITGGPEGRLCPQCCITTWTGATSCAAGGFCGPGWTNPPAGTTYQCLCEALYNSQGQAIGANPVCRITSPIGWPFNP